MMMIIIIIIMIIIKILKSGLKRLVEKSSSLGVIIMIIIIIMIVIFKSGLMRLVEKSSSLAPGGDSANIVMSPYHDAAAARHPLDPKP